MYYDILDNERRAVLAKLSYFKDRYYLAGGTGLALQLGHRDSIDFNFFTNTDIDTKELFLQIMEVFAGNEILKKQEEHNTLTVFINRNIKLSFFTYKYKLLQATIKESNINIASILDIACMKLSAITSRSTNKDYVDLYYILQKLSLVDLFLALADKIPELDTALVLKSLVYFDDLEIEPLSFKNNKEVDLATIKAFFLKELKDYSLKQILT